MVAVLGMVLWVMAVLVILAACGALPAVAAESPEDLYAQARKTYQSALGISDKGQRIDELRKCIQQLRQVVTSDTRGKVSDKCTYLIGQSRHAIYDLTQGREDFSSTLDAYRTVVREYPRSPLADDAQYLIGVLYISEDPGQAYLEFAKVRLFFPNGDMRPKAAQRAQQLAGKLGCDSTGKKAQTVSTRVKEKKGPEEPKEPKDSKELKRSKEPTELKDQKRSEENKTGEGGKDRAGKKGEASQTGADAGSRNGPPACPTLSRLEKIQHWSAQDYTRVVLYTSGPINYTEKAIPADPQKKQPGKINVELMDCAVNPKMKSRVRIMDRFLKEVRAEQCESTLARVVVDTKAIESYRIFPMTDPARLIIDVRGSARKPDPLTAKLDPDAIKSTLPTLAHQLALDVKRIVLDPGHGGKDKGGIGPNNVYEKDIVLSIAKRLKKKLEAKTGCEVTLTRTKDRFISLEERTAIANSKKADLFISIHTNAHEDRQYHGIETYFLNLSNDQESARVAALENATTTKKVSDLEAILHDLLLNTKLNESSRLARGVQRHTVSAVKTDYENVRDLGTKQAPFYVLLGAEMPSILIETAFITNEEEVTRLKDPAFQDKLAQGITAGVQTYIQQVRGFAKRGDQ
jgi:N-acetylmuramoyl-L-alanine amidase